MIRREFLKLAGIGSVVAFAPKVLRAAAASGATRAASGVRWDRSLVLVDLAGGNDGLNTVVPHGDPAYYRLRPGLAIRREQVLPLSRDLGFHRSLEALMAAWNGGELCIALGVGYDNPNLSHFRSIQIWETASDTEEYLSDGWLARLFSADPPPAADLADGIVLGRDMGPLAGDLRVIAMDQPDRFVQQAAGVSAAAPPPPGNAALAHLLEVQNEVHRAGGALEQRLRSAPPLQAEFPQTKLGRQLETAARLLSGGPVPVIKVTHPGFDNHSNQPDQHARLLEELAGGLGAFRLAMTKAGLWDRVLVMTYSEFGRRAAENGSLGTDHGTAAPHFLMGGRVKGGFAGAQPALGDLQGENLVAKVDFRRLYSTVARRWWELPSSAVKGLDRAPLDVIA